MTDPILAQLAALKGAPVAGPKDKWRDFIRHENRRPITGASWKAGCLPHSGTGLWRAEKRDRRAAARRCGQQYDGKAAKGPRGEANACPIAGTRLIREWQGIEHCVTVRDDDFEYQGRPYKSLSAIAREITGTRWNGWVFFGLKNHRGAA